MNRGTIGCVSNVGRITCNPKLPNWRLVLTFARGPANPKLGGSGPFLDVTAHGARSFDSRQAPLRFGGSRMPGERRAGYNVDGIVTHDTIHVRLYLLNGD